MMTPQKKWITVRIDGEMIPPLEKMIENVRDEFGMPRFKNKSDAVTKGLKEFLKKYSKKEEYQ